MADSTKLATTAEVTVKIRYGLDFKSYPPVEVTPMQLLRSGWANDRNDARDDERVVVQVAVDQVLRRELNLRDNSVAVEATGTWESRGYGSGHSDVWHDGRWELTDGQACLDVARRLQESRV